MVIMKTARHFRLLYTALSWLFMISWLATPTGRAQTESVPAGVPQEESSSAPADAADATPVAVLKSIPRSAVLGDQHIDFTGGSRRSAGDVVWLDDGKHYLQRRGGEWLRVEAFSGNTAPAYDRDKLEQALREHPDFDADAARRLSKQPNWWTDKRDAIVLEHAQRLYFYRFSTNQLRLLTREVKRRDHVDPAPLGKAISFVRDNDLYIIDAQTGRQRRVTRDGGARVLNGVLDWVYQEEIFGRGNWRASWWRFDDEYLAFFRLDESGVPVYKRADYMPLYANIIEDFYPKAGQTNPTVRLGIASRHTGRVAWVDLSRYAGIDFLIVRVSWSPAGKLLYTVQDREQRWLELNEADPRSGASRTLIREISPAWANDLGHPYWLPDKGFLWLSERDGYCHLYRYDAEGRRNARLTEGDWAVKQIIGYDAEQDWVYFTGFRETVLEQHAYRVRPDGTSLERLTEAGYSHNVSFDPTRAYFLDTFSNSATPTRVHLRRADGSLVRIVSENEVPALDEYLWSSTELVCIENRRGLPLYARIIRPPDFDPAKKYPVWCEVYGGPGAQSVRNAWGGNRDVLDQFLAQNGYIVFEIDPHSSNGAVAAAAWQAYCRLGESELQDVEDGLRWLIAQGCADPERIGITGASYGGYLAAYALTHSPMFKLGIAELLPADWRNYDSIYTERFMQTPVNNPEGYRRAELLNAAGDLQGRLLLIHGMLDENVHFQNTVQFIEALQREKKMFDLMAYPRDGHGIGHGSGHARRLRLDYILEGL